MEQLKESILRMLRATTEIDWLIVHKVSQLNIFIENVEFSFVDGKERMDQPFKTNQGYIVFKNTSSISEFEQMILSIVEDLSDNQVALGNLFIIASRVSHRNEHKMVLVKGIRDLVGATESFTLFNSLIVSLNKTYYAHQQLSTKIPSTIKDWLDLVHSTDYLHSISDPLISSLQLVRNNRLRKISFTLIASMKPLLRSVVVGMYGYDLEIEDERIQTLRESKNEMLFIAAYLIDDFQPNKAAPRWLTKSLVDIFFDKYWTSIGVNILFHIYGLSYRSKSENPLYGKLKNYVHTNLKNSLGPGSATSAIEKIDSLRFPDEMISLFSWIVDKKIAFDKIDSAIRKAICDQFIHELKRISKELPVSLADNNDPFNSYLLKEPKYQNTLTYILLFLIFSNNDDFKEVRNICLDFKTLFYGAYRARILAIRFSEMMLLIALSGHKLKGLEDRSMASLQKLLDILTQTILVPYVHLTERNEEIWNPDSDGQQYNFEAGMSLINTNLRAIKNHEVFKLYEPFFKTIDSVKIANWPYERETAI